MSQITSNLLPDRGSTPLLSSGHRRLLPCLLAAGAALTAAPSCAQPVPDTANPLLQQVRAPLPVLVQPMRGSDALSNAVSDWRSLQQSETFSFAAYASFLVAHPGWPGESGLRKNAEKMLRADGESPSLVTAFFTKFPPQTATAYLRFAEALDVGGRRSEAQSAARLAWISGALTPEDEARFLSRYSGAIQPGDHDLRMERLLWSRSTQTALRQITLVSPARRAAFNARLGFLTKAVDAAARDAAVDAATRTDAGFVADRTYWMRTSGQTDAAASYLAQRRQLNAPPADAGTWLATLEGGARSAQASGQHQTAYAIAQQLEVTYPANTQVRDRPFTERDTYTNVAWIGGNSAMNKLGRPSEAIRMFQLYANAAKSPQTRAKGFYWAGRAAERAGLKDQAIQNYSAAAEYFDQFHGQLAHERLGRQVALPLTTGTIEISGAEREAFNRNEVVRATIYLGQTGNREEQTRFVRTLAANADGAANHALAAELALRIDRPDLGLLVGKSAREDGLPGYLRPAFPITTVPPELGDSWTIIHAITRQESQFDRQAKSKAGARGLMQLMPGTARETANAAGVVYSYDGLTSNPQDNIRLGATYFGRLMTIYGGSYVLSVAAYNAGPGNVNKWLRANGDPRTSGTDVIDWIEAIPLSETRGYVQRVLENAVVYDLLNPRRNGKPGTRISTFLGRSGSFGAP
jgi:soluble lytic murein transglycosylase